MCVAVRVMPGTPAIRSETTWARASYSFTRTTAIGIVQN
jgi:hypothetical protein